MSDGFEHRTAKRSLGQNFLRDVAVIDRIVASLDPRVGDTIVEIGPGRGALTEKLVASGATVIAIEIDSFFAPALRAQFHFQPNFSVIEADILNIRLAAVLPDTVHAPVKLIGNLPYNISTAILERIAAERTLISQAVFMFQREVVERITAKPGQSERGYFTVLVEAAFESKYLFDVPPEAFSPRPNVWSSVVTLAPNPPTAADEPAFRKFIAPAFAQKRKNILNNLKNVMPNAAAFLANSNIDPRRRAETLTLKEWLTLYAAKS